MERISQTKKAFTFHFLIMKKAILIIYFFVFLQCLYSQENRLGKAQIVPKEIVEFSQDDIYNRFDNTYYNHSNLRKFEVQKKEDTIILKYIHHPGLGSGFFIEIQLNKDLNILKANYRDVTCSRSFNGTTTAIKLQLNQDPFEKLQGLQGQFELKFNKVFLFYSNKRNDIRRCVFHGKFKLFNNVKSAISSQEKIDFSQNMKFSGGDSYNFTSVNDVYLHSDMKPIIQNESEFVEAVNKLNIKTLPSTIYYRIKIGANGNIKDFSMVSSQMSEKELSALTTLLHNLPLEITPAYYNGKKVAYSGEIFMNLK